MFIECQLDLSVGYSLLVSFYVHSSERLCTLHACQFTDLLRVTVSFSRKNASLSISLLYYYDF
jgi:hypothetical protein